MEIEERDGVTLVVTDERLDAVVASKLKDAVLKIVEDSDNPQLVIDMGKTRFVDSAGCGVLIASLRMLNKNNGDMKIARPSPQALSLFELTQLTGVFDIFDDVESAIRSFG